MSLLLFRSTRMYASVYTIYNVSSGIRLNVVNGNNRYDIYATECMNENNNIRCVVCECAVIQQIKCFLINSLWKRVFICFCFAIGHALNTIRHD